MASNPDFDFETFAVSTIQFIDSIRSFERVANAPTESRINAFYRAIGLPAVVRDDKSKEKSGKKKTPSLNLPDKFNNGNIFDSGDLSYKTYENAFFVRQDKFSESIKEEEIDQFIDTNTKSIKNSIKEVGGRTRGILFPPVVDGAIHIYPQDRRIAGAFMSRQESTHSKIAYTRPLLETIIFIRLKGENVVDKSKQSDLSLSFQSESLENLNKIAFDRLSNTLSNLGQKIENIGKKSGALRKKSGLRVVPTVANIAQQNLEVREPETNANRGELDIREINLQNKISIQQAVTSLFEFNDVINKTDTKSLRDSALSSQLLSILSPENEGSDTKKALKSVKEQKEKAKTEAKALARLIDLLYGEFSGLSGIDVLAVIISLFNMTLEELVGLLNQESKDRLAKLKGSDLPAIKNATSVTVSIDALKREMSIIFDEVDVFMKRRKHKEKRKNQKK